MQGVTAKAVVLAVLALLQSIVVWCTASLLMPSELQGASAFGGITVLACTGFAAACIGLLVPALFASATQIANGVTLLTLTSITLSGFLKQADEMGRLSAVASNLPFTLGCGGIGQTLAQQQAWPEVALVLAESVVVLLGAGAMTAWASRRTLAR